MAALGRSRTGRRQRDEVALQQIWQVPAPETLGEDLARLPGNLSDIATS
ncbi:MAG: hypothetical protein RMM28_01935 [Thermoleophilia bacterium]|nr:hypothetical protein [Thermoleophilia bacterium]